MLANCVICNTTIDRPNLHKLNLLIPSVCSVSCFKAYLDLIKVPTKEELMNKIKNSKLAIQYLEDERPFRSKSESAISEFFKKHKINYVYEKYVFFGENLKSYSYQPLTNRYYIPDFFLTDYNIFVEVKSDEAVNRKPLEVAKVIPLIILTPQFITKLKGA